MAVVLDSEIVGVISLVDRRTGGLSTGFVIAQRWDLATMGVAKWLNENQKGRWLVLDVAIRPACKLPARTLAIASDVARSEGLYD